MLNELDLQLQMDKHYELCSFDVEYLEEPVKPVIHNIPKLLFFTEGTGKIKIYNKEFDVVPNTLLMIFPWEIVEITQVEKPLAMMKISYNSVFNNFILNSLNRYKKSKNNILSLIKKIPVVYFNKIEAKTIKNIFYEIKNEVGLESLSDFKPFFNIGKEENATKDEFDLSTVYITNKLTELIILIAKKNIRDEKCANKTEDSDTNIVKYIYAHLNEKLTLNKLSVIFFMSESSISKYLEEVTGFMFNDLLRHMRISKALNLLVYTDLNIEEIAHLVGFVDGAHISNLCSKHLKMSPNKYREKYKDMYQIFNEKEQQLVSDVIKYIYENYTKELTINDVTEEFDITDTKLNKILMSYSGKRFIEFLNALKIDKACEMLLTTDKSVIDISFELGFNTVKTFNNNFSKLKNMSPTDFRKTVKHGS